MNEQYNYVLKSHRGSWNDSLHEWIQHSHDLRLDISKSKVDVVSLSLLLPVCFRSCRFIVNPPDHIYSCGNCNGTHISLRRSSPLIPRFFKYLMIVFPVFCNSKSLWSWEILWDICAPSSWTRHPSFGKLLSYPCSWSPSPLFPLDQAGDQKIRGV